MLLELINLAKLRRAFIYAGIVLLALWLQNLVLSQVVILNASPMIIPIIVVAIGFFEGGIWGGVYGLVIGLVCDMTFNESGVMMTVLFPIFGFFSGALAMFVMSRRLMPFFCVCVCSLLITAICQMFRFVAFTDTDVVYAVLTGVFQVVWSLPFIFAIFYPCRTVSRLDLSK